jgi:hypothetical protein
MAEFIQLQPIYKQRSKQNPHTQVPQTERVISTGNAYWVRISGVATPHLRQLVAGLTPRLPWFDPVSDHGDQLYS